MIRGPPRSTRTYTLCPYTTRFRAPRVSAGSGVIVDASRGLVVTNHHVIANARAIAVGIGDRRVEAELVGSDPRTDLAVLRIEAGDLRQLPLAEARRTQVGDYVVAIGNQFQVGQTVTAGIVSAIRSSADGGSRYVPRISRQRSEGAKR